MKRDRRLFIASLAAFAMLTTVNVLAHSAESSARWSVQVSKVDASDVNLAPSFQIAIYENLLDQLSKARQFKRVLREGDRNAAGAPDLLVLKTTVEKYAAGSETRRAVTTFSGATKLTVRARLCLPDGKVILERTVQGNVRFIGSNLRATHNLARNVAKTLKKSPLPEPPLLALSQEAASTSSDGIVRVEFP